MKQNERNIVDEEVRKTSCWDDFYALYQKLTEETEALVTETLDERWQALHTTEVAYSCELFALLHQAKKEVFMYKCAILVMVVIGLIGLIGDCNG